MRLLLVLLLLAFAAPALADAEFREGKDSVRITALPCTAPSVLQRLQAAGEDPVDFRAASADLGGKTFAACWRPVFDQRVIYLRYDDGDTGLVPFDDWKPVKQA